MANNDEIKVSQDAIKIGQALTAGILLEASCYPSPGLVSPFSMGAHKDMNFLSFMLGSSAISPYFTLFGQIGINWDGETFLLKELRKIGINAEEQLLQMTKGINTQRGILFLGGIVAAACGKTIKSGKLNIKSICKNVSKICEGLVERELKSLTPKKACTNGEKLFLKYGTKGIRGELERGLPSVCDVSYPRFIKGMESGIGINYSMIDSLLHLIMTVEDTTILSRLGPNGLKKAQLKAKEAIEKGSVYSEQGRKGILQLDEYFTRENISPGGCADLLAITVAIYILEGREIKLNDILSGYYNKAKEDEDVTKFIYKNS